MTAEALHDILTGALRGPCIVERSAKITPGALQTDRRLFSFPRRALYPGPRRRLAALVERLGLADPSPVLDALPGAQAVHFGADGPIRKCYLEYAPDTAPQPGLLFLAVKWRDGAVRVDHYFDRSPLTQAAKHALLAQAVPSGPARTCGAEMLALARAGDPDGTAVVLEVVGHGDARRSVDISVADAARTLGALDGTLAPVMGIAGEAGEAFLRAQAGAVLGHFAAGCGPDGTAFATLYYGAAPR